MLSLTLILHFKFRWKAFAHKQSKSKISVWTVWISRILLPIFAFKLTPKKINSAFLSSTALHLTLHGDSWPFDFNSPTPGMTQVVRRATVERAWVKHEQRAFKGQMVGRTAPLYNLCLVPQTDCVLYLGWEQWLSHLLRLHQWPISTV